MSQNNIVALIGDDNFDDFVGNDGRRTLDLNHMFQSGCTLLTVAVRKSDLASIVSLIQKGNNVDQREEGGATPLLLAVYLNRLDVVKLLVQKSASINKGDSYNTPLTLALSKGHLRIVKFLVEKGAKIDGVDAEEKSPVFLAIEEGNLKMLEALVKYGVPKDLKNTSGESPIIAAIRNGSSKEIVQCLLKNGAHISNSTLMLLAKKGAVDVIRILIESGADANVVVADGNTPLATAVRYQQVSVVRYLVSLGVNICKVGPKGKTPLLWAIVNQDLSLLKYLLNHGAAFTANSVFLDAIETKNLDIVQMMFEAGADKQRVKTQTPLAKALEVESVEIVKYLLDNGANFAEDLDNNETSHVIDCIKKKNYEMVKLLTERGAKLERFGSCGNTPLTKAIQDEDFQMVKFCVEQNADVNQPNRHNLTPLAVAVKVDDFRTFQYLVEAGANLENDPMKGNIQMLHYYKLAKENIARKKQEFKELASNQEDADGASKVATVDDKDDNTTVLPKTELKKIILVLVKQAVVQMKEEFLDWSQRFYQRSGLKEKIEKYSSSFQTTYFWQSFVGFILALIFVQILLLVL